MSAPGYTFTFGTVVATASEMMEIDLKLSEMEENVGVSFTPRELMILKAILKDTVKPERFVLAEFGGRGEENRVLIEESISEGHCYLRFLVALPNIAKVSKFRLNDIIHTMKETLGKNVDGMELMTYLTLADAVMSGDYDIEAIQSDNASILQPIRRHAGTLEAAMNSKARFTYREAGGLFHVESSQLSCDCTDILCNHGWASKFMFQAIARNGIKVGADIDMSALFVKAGEKIQEKDVQSKFSIYHDTTDTHTFEKELSKDLCASLEEALDKRTELLHQTFEQLLKDRLNPQKQEVDGDDICSTVLPNDSSSVLSRYQKNFMNPGTIYNFKANKTSLEPVQEVGDLQVEKNVVQGFKKTVSMAQEEQESNDRVYMINGLAAPLKNSRLNFLMHFHTALTECSFDPALDPIDALESLGCAKPKNPTEELVKQVVQRTFDFDQSVVIANPFRIPFIEVGMPITDSAILKSIDLLHSEYRSLWFQEFKCLRVPQFHDEFSKFSTSVKRVDRRHRTTRGRTAHSHDDLADAVRKGPAPSKGIKQRRPATLLSFGL